MTGSDKKTINKKTDQPVAGKRRTTPLRFAAFLLLILLTFFFLSDAMVSTEQVPVISIRGFYKEEADSLDVLLIGASEVYTSWSPTLAWEEYGFTSYDLASPGLTGNLYKTLLKEALKTQSPSLVVFEISGFLCDDDSYDNQPGVLRSVIDNMRWSENRLEAIREVVPEEDRAYFYLPLLSYHDKWAHPKYLLKNDIAKLLLAFHETTNLKGMATVSDISDMETAGITEQLCFTEKGRAYLTDLLDFCQEEGLTNVLFYRAPRGSDPENPEVLKETWDLIESYGYDTLDCSAAFEETGIDLSSDFYSSEHLNLFGMEKFTSWFGSFLRSHYDLPSSHSEELSVLWDTCAENTDTLLESCREDILAGRRRQYTETSLYNVPEF